MELAGEVATLGPPDLYCEECVQIESGWNIVWVC